MVLVDFVSYSTYNKGKSNKLYLISLCKYYRNNLATLLRFAMPCKKFTIIQIHMYLCHLMPH